MIFVGNDTQKLINQHFQLLRSIMATYYDLLSADLLRYFSNYISEDLIQSLCSISQIVKTAIFDSKEHWITLFTKTLTDDPDVIQRWKNKSLEELKAEHLISTYMDRDKDIDRPLYINRCIYNSYSQKVVDILCQFSDAPNGYMETTINDICKLDAFYILKQIEKVSALQYKFDVDKMISLCIKYKRIVIVEYLIHKYLIEETVDDRNLLISCIKGQKCEFSDNITKFSRFDKFKDECKLMKHLSDDIRTAINDDNINVMGLLYKNNICIYTAEGLWDMIYHNCQNMSIQMCEYLHGKVTNTDYYARIAKECCRYGKVDLLRHILTQPITGIDWMTLLYESILYQNHQIIKYLLPYLSTKYFIVIGNICDLDFFHLLKFLIQHVYKDEIPKVMLNNILSEITRCERYRLLIKTL